MSDRAASTNPPKTTATTMASDHASPSSGPTNAASDSSKTAQPSSSTPSNAPHPPNKSSMTWAQRLSGKASTPASTATSSSLPTSIPTSDTSVATRSNPTTTTKPRSSSVPRSGTEEQNKASFSKETRQSPSTNIAEPNNASPVTDQSTALDKGAPPTADAADPAEKGTDGAPDVGETVDAALKVSKGPPKVNVWQARQEEQAAKRRAAEELKKAEEATNASKAVDDAAESKSVHPAAGAAGQQGTQVPPLTQGGQGQGRRSKGKKGAEGKTAGHQGSSPSANRSNQTPPQTKPNKQPSQPQGAAQTNQPQLSKGGKGPTSSPVSSKKAKQSPSVPSNATLSSAPASQSNLSVTQAKDDWPSPVEDKEKEEERKSRQLEKEKEMRQKEESVASSANTSPSNEKKKAKWVPIQAEITYSDSPRHAASQSSQTTGPNAGRAARRAPSSPSNSTKGGRSVSSQTAESASASKKGQPVSGKSSRRASVASATPSHTSKSRKEGNALPAASSVSSASISRSASASVQGQNSRTNNTSSAVSSIGEQSGVPSTSTQSAVADSTTRTTPSVASNMPSTDDKSDPQQLGVAVAGSLHSLHHASLPAKPDFTADGWSSGPNSQKPSSQVAPEEVNGTTRSDQVAKQRDTDDNSNDKPAEAPSSHPAGAATETPQQTGHSGPPAHFVSGHAARGGKRGGLAQQARPPRNGYVAPRDRNGRNGSQARYGNLNTAPAHNFPTPGSSSGVSVNGAQAPQPYEQYPMQNGFYYDHAFQGGMPFYPDPNMQGFYAPVGVPQGQYMFGGEHMVHPPQPYFMGPPSFNPAGTNGFAETRSDGSQMGSPPAGEPMELSGQHMQPFAIDASAQMNAPHSMPDSQGFFVPYAGSAPIPAFAPATQGSVGTNSAFFGRPAPLFNYDSYRFPPDGVAFWVLGQLEFYMSPDNLAKDVFLRQNMDDQGWINISLIASFNRLKQLTTDVNLVRSMMELSYMLEVNQQHNKVRCNEWKQWILPGARKSNVASHEPTSTSNSAAESAPNGIAPGPSTVEATDA